MKKKRHVALQGLTPFCVVWAVFSTFLLVFSSVSQADSDICYAVADSVDQLVQMNRLPVPNTTFNDIGPTGTTRIESIALYLDGTTVYAADANTLGTLNTSTGAFTAVGGTFGSGNGTEGTITFSDVDGLAFDALTGFFYGAHRRGAAEDILFRIDRLTGLAVPDAFGPGVDYVVINTSVLAGGLDDIDDIGVDPDTGQMYAVANNGGAADHLVTIDKLTGEVTDVAVFSDGTNNITDIEGLGFYNDGRFYAVTGNNGVAAFNNTFFDVELATALITSILPFPSYSDYEGVACLSGGANHIAGTVFVDNNRDGVSDGSGWPNVDLQLFLDVNGDGVVDAGDILIQTTTTDANGDYDFMTGAAGPFVVRVDIATQPVNNSFTTDNIELAIFPIPPSTSPTFGVTDSGNDFGIGAGINTLSGNVFNDHINGDGVLDPGELGETGITVRLYEDNNNNGIVDAGDHWVGSVVTDANGDYSFDVGLGNFVLDIDGTDLPSGATQTTNPPNFSQEVDFSNPALGESATGNDFGFKLPASDYAVTKTSSVVGTVMPGDTIDYTITITNNGSADATNIVVDDPLPADTTYMLQSTLVNGFAQGTGATVGDFSDDFQTGDYSGNTGSFNFAGYWIERDSVGGSENITVEAVAGCPTPNNLCLRVESETTGDNIYREMDLSSSSGAILTYDYNQEDLRNGEIVIEVSSDGGANYTILKTYLDGPFSGAESFDISAYMASNTRIRFRVTDNDNNENLRMDNVQITVQGDTGSTTALIKDNIPDGVNADLDDGVLPSLVTANDDFALQPGQSMTVTYSVLVDDPLSSLPVFITNTVSVTSDQTPDPERATVSDPVGYDYGDAPANYGIPVHIALSSPELYLGTVPPDPDTDGSGNIAADTDDTTGIDDEEGVTFSSPAGGARAEIIADVEVVNDSGDDAFVCAWLDRWTAGGSENAVLDGSFDAADIATAPEACQVAADNNGTATTMTFSWSNLPNVSGFTYARFRVCTTQSECDIPDGYASDGEGEDYRIDFDFTPTAVTIGKVELSATRVTDFLGGLGVVQMNRAALLALLQVWDPAAAAALSDDAGREEIFTALHNYLDPDGDGQVAVFKWDTLEERGTIGFYVKRAADNDNWVLVNNDMLPGLINAPMGGEYLLVDPVPQSGQTYQYLLIEQEATGNTREYGPYNVEVE